LVIIVLVVIVLVEVVVCVGSLLRVPRGSGGWIVRGGRRVGSRGDTSLVRVPALGIVARSSIVRLRITTWYWLWIAWYLIS